MIYQNIYVVIVITSKLRHKKICEINYLSFNTESNKEEKFQKFF